MVRFNLQYKCAVVVRYFNKKKETTYVFKKTKFFKCMCHKKLYFAVKITRNEQKYETCAPIISLKLAITVECIEIVLFRQSSSFSIPYECKQ